MTILPAVLAPLTPVESIDIENAAQAVRVALWARLTIRAIRLACGLHGVNFRAIVAKELARP